MFVVLAVSAYACVQVAAARREEEGPLRLEPADRLSHLGNVIGAGGESNQLHGQSVASSDTGRRVPFLPGDGRPRPGVTSVVSRQHRPRSSIPQASMTREGLQR
jgi:hypothetical protein